MKGWCSVSITILLVGAITAQSSPGVKKVKRSQCHSKYSCSDCKTAQICKPLDEGFLRPLSKVRCPNFCDSSVGTCVDYFPMNCESDGYCPKESYCRNDETSVSCQWNKVEEAFKFVKAQKCENYSTCSKTTGKCVPLTCSSEYTCLDDNTLVACNKNDEGLYTVVDKVACTGLTPFCNRWLGGCVSEENRNVSLITQCPNEHTCLSDNILIHCERNENGTYFAKSNEKCGGSTPFCNAWLGSCVSEENRGLSLFSKCSSHHSCLNEKTLLVCEYNKNHTYVLRQKVKCERRTPFCNAWLGACVSEENRALGPLATCPTENVCLNDHILLNCKENGNGTFVLHSKVKCTGSTPYCNAWLGSCTKPEYLNISETSCPTENICVNEELLLSCKKNENGTYMEDRRVTCGGQNPFCNAWLGSCVSKENRNITEKSVCSAEYTCVNDNIIVNCKKNENGIYEVDNKVICGGQTPFCNAWLGSCVSAENRNISETSSCSAEHTCVNNNILLNCKKGGNGTYFVNSKVNCGGETPFCNAFLGSCVSVKSRALVISAPCSADHACVNENLLLKCHLNENGSYVVDNKESCGGQTPFCNAWLGSCVAEESRNISETSTFSAEHTCVNDNLLLNCKKDGNGTYVFDNKVSCRGQTPFCNAWLGTCVAEETRNLSSLTSCTSEYSCLNGHLLLVCNRSESGNYTVNRLVKCLNKTLCNSTLGQCVPKIAATPKLVVIPNQHTEEDKKIDNNLLKTIVCPNEIYCKDDYTLVVCNKTDSGDYEIWREERCPKTRPTCDKLTNACIPLALETYIPQGNKSIGCNSIFSCADCKTLRVCKPSLSGALEHYKDTVCYGERPFCDRHIGSCVDRQPLECGEKDNLICTEDGAYPDNDCTAYHICKGGIPNKFSCGKNRSFNPRKGVCEEGGECGKFRCAKGQDGFKSAHSIYNEYYAFCSSEHLLISKCHNHLRFNVTMQRCEAACSKDGELLVHPSDCHRFVICREGIVHGKPYFFREIGVCPEGQAFQPGHSTCVDQNLVKGCSTSKPTVWTEDLAALMKEAGALEGKAETLLTGRQASATPIREGLFSFGQGLLKGDEAEAAGWAVPVTLTRANTRSLAVYRNPTCKGIFSCLDCSTLQICTPGENSTWQPKASVKCGQATPYCDPDVGSCVAYQPNACTAPSNFVCVTDGIFPDQNCRRFQVCRNLKSRMYECSQNHTVFDPRRERCVLGGPCGQFQCDPQAAGGYTVPHSAYPEYAGLCEEEHGIKLVYKCHGNNRLNVTSQRCEPLCREDGERISDPDDCRKYYECREFWKASVRGFEKQSKTCPPGTAFHPKFSFCFQEHEVVACRSSKAHPPLYHNHRKRIASSNQTAVI